ncbi:MAG: type II toxin-antitoxin system HicB family antitoxin [Gemmataceae bacterium]
MKYKIVLHRSEEGISVSVPAASCWSEGATEEEALANIEDAIREYLAALEDRFRDAEVREVEVRVSKAMPRIPGVNHQDAVRAAGKGRLRDHPSG